MKLSEIGNLLKEERFSRGLYIEDVASKLKISPRILRALENGDLSDLPHLVYTKGFIKSYGNYLGFTHEELILDDEEQEENSKEEFVIPVQAKSRRSKFPLLLLIAALVVAAGVGVFYYTNMQTDTDINTTLNSQLDTDSTNSINTKTNEITQSTEVKITKPILADRVESTSIIENVENPVSVNSSANDLLNTSTAQAAETNLAYLPSATNDLLSTANQDKITGELIASSEHNSTSSTKSSSLTAEEMVTTNNIEDFDESREVKTNAFGVDSLNNRNAVVVEKKDIIPAGMHQAVVVAVEDCWIKSTADKKDTREFILKKGETFALTFKDALELKFGNAGGVTIRYDGQELGSPGKSGQVLTYKLPPK